MAGSNWICWCRCNSLRPAFTCFQATFSWETENKATLPVWWWHCSFITITWCQHKETCTHMHPYMMAFFHYQIHFQNFSWLGAYSRKDLSKLLCSWLNMKLFWLRREFFNHTAMLCFSSFLILFFFLLISLTPLAVQSHFAVIYLSFLTLTSPPTFYIDHSSELLNYLSCFTIHLPILLLPSFSF